jgi:S-layer protein
MASITTEQRSELIALYTAMFNAAPGATNLNDMVSQFESGKTLLQIATAYAAKTEFNTVYPTLLTSDEFAARLVGNLLGSEVSAGASTWATNWVKTQLAAGKSAASVISTAVQSIRSTTNVDFANAKALMANKVDVATYYSVTKLLSDPDLVDLQAVLNGVTSTAATVTTAKTTIDSIANVVIAQTLTLTTGANNLTGSAGNDNFAGGTKDSWSAFDNIDGGDGNDTMDVYITGTAVPGASTTKNVETLNLNTDGAGFTIDTTSMTGLTTLNLSDSAAGAINVTGPTTLVGKIVGTGASAVTVVGTGGALQITTGAGQVDVGQTAVANAITSVTVDGGVAVNIQDRSGTLAATGSKLTSVSLKANTGVATITANGLTALTLTNNAQNATVTSAAGTRALTVNLNKATAGTIADGEATTLTVKNSGSASSGVTLNAAKATSVTLDAATSANLTVADVNIAAATTLTATGAGKVTVSATSTVTALTTVDASGSTGGLVVTPALGNAVTVTGGAGADTVTLGATTKTITMGAGNDTVKLSAGTTALGTGGTIDAGDGTDTLAMAADDVNTASGGTTFETKISNFEEVELNAAGTAGVAVNMANLDDINKLKVSADIAQVVTVSNMASGGTVSYTAAAAQTAASTIGVLNANTGTDDSLNISISSTAGRNINTLTIADVETINIASDDSALTITNISHTASLTATSVKTIKVSGDAGLALTNTATTVTSFDASAVTGGSVSWTTGALAAAATVTGSATRANTIDTSASSKVMTVTGGSGVDTITTGAGADVINTAAGNDVISAGAGNDTINAGAGDDSITTGTGLDVVTGGDGADTFTLSVNANGNTYATITDAAKTDILTFVDKGTETFTTTKITLADTAAFQDFLDAAAAGDGSTNGAIKWFQYGGNTYVVEDMAAANTFQNGTDLVVKLTGAVDLSTATGAGTNSLTLA